MTAVHAPRTLGPHLHELGITERAVLQWESKRDEDRRKAERAAYRLAEAIFGTKRFELDDFVDPDFAARHRLEPRHLVTFNIDGHEFNYCAANKDKGESEHLVLIDQCPCGRGPRLIAEIRVAVDLGRALEWDRSRRSCEDCREDEAGVIGLANANRTNPRA